MKKMMQVSEAYVHHRQFEGYMAEVTGALIVFVLRNHYSGACHKWMLLVSVCLFVLTLYHVSSI